MVIRKKNEVLEKQYEEQGSCCYYCKDTVSFDLITRDHFNPVSGGHTLVNNKVFACRTCNSIKGNLSIDDFRLELIKRSCDILRTVKNNKWMISDEQIKKMKHYNRVLKTVVSIIENDYKPEIIFT